MDNIFSGDIKSSLVETEVERVCTEITVMHGMLMENEI